MTVSKTALGPLFIAFAAILWATDGLVRYPMVQKGINPILTVYFDHLIAILLLTPYVFYHHRKELFKMGRREWCGLLLIGAGGSALATVLFTASFRYVNPSVSILLQKQQPVLVVLLAMLFLGERPNKAFWIWAPIALMAGLTISFPDFNFHFLTDSSVASTGGLYAFGAAAIWALSTVTGKAVLFTVPPMVVTYWRFIFGFMALAGMLAATDGFEFAPLFNPEFTGSFLYVALIPGLLAMIVYYQGMMRAPASTTTFMELLFPITAVLLNTIFLKIPLSPIQSAAALVLLFAITQISLVGRSRESLNVTLAGEP